MDLGHLEIESFRNVEGHVFTYIDCIEISYCILLPNKEACREYCVQNNSQIIIVLQFYKINIMYVQRIHNQIRVTSQLIQFQNCIQIE
ncbi:unnamed protein product [Paramecium octaurelia]|uniref:Uncharacterized protein n=1 Tax=Paramecium octaurelia TaxID=43137 RepID=A0A8S1WXX1_PAROT|nr:unnamed protein product [Paramecium octaurelia]